MILDDLGVHMGVSEYKGPLNAARFIIFPRTIESESPIFRAQNENPEI